MALEAVGSNPIIHPVYCINVGIRGKKFVTNIPVCGDTKVIMGSCQAVRLRILIPACEGSNPSYPVMGH